MSRITWIAACLCAASLIPTILRAELRSTLLEEETGKLNSTNQAELTAPMDVSISFEEVYTHSIAPYWCEHNLVAGDYDEDGDIDMIAHVTTGGTSARDARVLLFTNDGTHRFVVSEIDSVREYGYDIVAADFNGDTHLDFAVRTSATRVYLGDGAGGFIEHQAISDGYGYGGFDCGDLDRDGDVDLVQGYQVCCGGRIAALYNDGTGTFTRGWEHAFTGSTSFATIRDLVITHLNTDAWPDIAASEIYGSIGYALLGQSGGALFSRSWSQYFGSRGGYARLFGVTDIDLDSDPVKEIVFSSGWGRMEMYRSDGGTLTPIWFSEDYGQASYDPGAGDFDGDGREDLFVNNFGNGRLHIYRNIDGDSLSKAWVGSVPGKGYLGSVVDINQDGLSDLVVGERGMIRVWLNRTRRAVQQVALDVKPGSCPNPINVMERPSSARAVVPAAILGSEELDVRDIDPRSLKLERLQPIRWSYEDVSTSADSEDGECACTEAGADGFEDLTVKFNKAELIASLPSLDDGEVISLTLSGRMLDGTPIEGAECVLIINRGSGPRSLALRPTVGDPFPNPGNPEISLAIDFPQAASYMVTVYNLIGRTIRSYAGYADPGTETITWDGTDSYGNSAGSGIYFFRVRVGDISQTKPMLLLK